ncbi:MAG: hypothetical protein EON59_00620 [Alphaproteobacteria bacterium]|nr:MAG: hypothetical protein EON59_00620 [Alphaproteobacteria bacterium]
MANSNIATGLTPRRHRNGAPFVGPLRKYYVPASDATALFIGDPVIIAGTGDDRGVPAVTRASVGGRITGVVVGIANDPAVPASNDMMELGYRAASTEGYVLVCDDPTVLYEIQEDSDTSTLAKTSIGLNADIIIAAGSTYTRRSGVMLDSSTAATTATLALRIVELEQRPDNEIGTTAKWLVAINLPTETGAAGSTGV